MDREIDAVTLSEHVQACRIRELTGFIAFSSTKLRCGNGTALSVDAGKDVDLSWPRRDDGPWTSFRVTLESGPRPEPNWTEGADGARSVQSGELVRILERLGWPEELGRRWKKPSGHVPAGR